MPINHSLFDTFSLFVCKNFIITCHDDIVFNYGRDLIKGDRKGMIMPLKFDPEVVWMFVLAVLFLN